MVMTTQKITAEHLKKKAIIYIRQSSMRQVQENKESLLYQIALKNKAAELGWRMGNIEIIDNDLGISGKSTKGRIGFEKLVSDISLSKVGIVFGYEVSRIARNCIDWYKLIELCSIFGTLIGDVDGVYNVNQYNDRLLLGLKGTMSEAELHLLHNRLYAGKLNKAKRGELNQPLPTGYIYDKDKGVVKDPDNQVQKVIELIFKKFDELSGMYRVLKYLKENKILIPRRSREKLTYNELFWKEPYISALNDFFKNPTYAGAFVFGRRKASKNSSGSGGLESDIEKWKCVVKDKFPAYISWGKYISIQKKLRDNYNAYNDIYLRKGIERQGKSLLQGIIYCGECGRKIRVVYKNRYRYICDSRAKTYIEKTCFSIPGEIIDREVEKVFFEAIRPSNFNILEEVLLKEQEDFERLSENWKQNIMRAEYNEKIAGKRYRNVDSDNRLVASELEKEWEEKIVELNSLKQEFEIFQLQKKSTFIEPKLKEELKNISEHLSEIWHKEQITNEHKKRLIRAIIDKVIVKKINETEVEIKIIWTSGHYTIIKARVPVKRKEFILHYKEIENLITKRFNEGYSDEQIAKELNKMEYKTARLKDFNIHTVKSIRYTNGLIFKKSRMKNAKERNPDLLTVYEVSKQVGENMTWIRYKIRIGTIKAKKDLKTGLLLIDKKSLEALKKISKSKRGIKKCTLRPQLTVS